MITRRDETRSFVYFLGMRLVYFLGMRRDLPCLGLTKITRITRREIVWSRLDKMRQNHCLEMSRLVKSGNEKLALSRLGGFVFFFFNASFTYIQFLLMVIRQVF
uniref:Uncharacterized protein n=1 Tax=Cacopsylla melanoneura TaxID=428564 RepID=A0A8D8R0Y8_9HEMI